MSMEYYFPTASEAELSLNCWWTLEPLEKEAC